MGIFSATLQDAMKYLSDGFLLPGVLCAGVGALIWIGSFGTYDAIGYTVSNIGRRFHVTKSNFGERAPDFHSYKEAKDTKGRKSYPFLIFVGLGAIALAILFQILFTVV